MKSISDYYTAGLYVWDERVTPCCPPPAPSPSAAPVTDRAEEVTDRRRQTLVKLMVSILSATELYRHTWTHLVRRQV